jgi:hypothetical protein
MIVQDLYDEIVSNFALMPMYGEVVASLNTVIRKINAEMVLPDSQFPVTGTYSLPISDIEDNWEDIDLEWQSMGRFNDGYSWDSDTLSLTLPKHITKVLAIMTDDETYECIPYDELKTQGTDDIKCAMVGNVLYLNKDISTLSNEIIIKCKMVYPLISGIEYDGMTDNFFALLVAGSVYLLSAKPKYMDKNIFAIAKDNYDKAWLSLSDQVLDYGIRDHATAKYTF